MAGVGPAARNRLAIGALAGVVAIFGQGVGSAGAAGPSGVSYRNSGVSASYSFFPVDPSMPQINITVSQSSNVTRPLGGPATTTSETNLNLSTFDGVNFNSGCFRIPESDAAIAADLSTASLHVTVTDA